MSYEVSIRLFFDDVQIHDFTNQIKENYFGPETEFTKMFEEMLKNTEAYHNVEVRLYRKEGF